MLIGALALVVGASVFKDRKSAGPAQAPPVTLDRLGGGKIDLPKGKVTMVDFWATWCAPCRVSMPRLQQVWADYAPRGVELYSVDTDDAGPDREPMVQEFLLQNRLSFPVALDDGSAQTAFAVQNLPTLLVVGRDGRVAWRHVGVLNGGTERELRKALEEALGAN